MARRRVGVRRRRRLVVGLPRARKSRTLRVRKPRVVGVKATTY